ncbi:MULTISPECIES: IS3 family transposase [unclassified Arthrobacter]|uniref:IS3 family transposase n=1 Tax=unclassified Arthrobacter TaxID=235627 RepID=UPI001C84517C|nr:hypothetical protein [Arthrobacter sp. MAHUQ-56]
MKDVFVKNQGRYGYRRIHTELLKQGRTRNKDRAEVDADTRAGLPATAEETLGHLPGRGRPDRPEP